MIVEKRKVDGNTVLHVEGVIRLGQSAEFFAQTLDKTLREEDGDVFIELSKIDHIDSTGIGELVGYLGRFKARERRLVLVDPSVRIQKLLEIGHLAELFPTFKTLDQALAAEA